ncbi:MAG: hypothetical protein ACE5MK_13780, partial [Acidobacteriota bacterium]
YKRFVYLYTLCLQSQAHSAGWVHDSLIGSGRRFMYAEMFRFAPLPYEDVAKVVASVLRTDQARERSKPL